MSKIFSVEWLSQSSHAAAQEMDRRILNEVNSNKSHGSSQMFNPIEGEKKSPSSPTNSCGYTSGSDSDVGDDSEGETGPHRRVRTKFTSEQISRLEKAFNKHRYLGATQRRKLAEKLHLSETQVKTWFQNRRMKLKREVQDMRAEFFIPTLVPPVAFQHHALSGQRPPLFTGARPPYPPHALQRTPAQPPLHPMLFTPCYY